MVLVFFILKNNYTFIYIYICLRETFVLECNVVLRLRISLPEEVEIPDIVRIA